MNKAIIPILNPGDEPILAGRLSGKRAFLRALEQLPDFAATTLVVANFRGADYVTSSFLSELIFPLRDHVRLRQAQGYVIFANLSEQIREEVEEYLRRSGDAIIACNMSEDGQITNVNLLGRLDEKLRETLEMVIRKGEASAVELHAESRDSKSIGPTAFNNRLAALAAKSLVIETLHGRAKKYRPILEMT